MADLTTKKRDHLHKYTFGLPGKRAYPMPDANHARLAKAMAAREVNAGKLSESAKARIDAKANKVLAK